MAWRRSNSVVNKQLKGIQMRTDCVQRAWVVTQAMVLAGVATASGQTYGYPGPPPGTAPGQPYVYPVPPPPPGAYPAPPMAYPAPPGPGLWYLPPPDAGPYLTLDAGPTYYQDGQLNTFGGPATGTVRYSVGASADVGIGYAFNKYVAAGLDLGLNTTTIDSIPGYYLSDAQFYNLPFLANVTFSWPLAHGRVTPFIGGGAGGSDSVFNPGSMSDLNFNNTVSGEADSVVFAWEAYAGLRFNLTPNLAFGVEYKYFGTGAPTFSYPPAPNFDVGFSGVQTHSILANFELSF
ncbi:MAG: outer membrane beta-barrel protein [Acidocella sp.]|nr:outer membrane beta-barrel protein [Acidocella sp.]